MPGPKSQNVYNWRATFRAVDAKPGSETAMNTEGHSREQRALLKIEDVGAKKAGGREGPNVDLASTLTHDRPGVRREPKAFRNPLNRYCGPKTIR